MILANMSTDVAAITSAVWPQRLGAIAGKNVLIGLTPVDPASICPVWESDMVEASTGQLFVSNSYQRTAREIGSSKSPSESMVCAVYNLPSRQVAL